MLIKNISLIIKVCTWLQKSHLHKVELSKLSRAVYLFTYIASGKFSGEQVEVYLLLESRFFKK